MSRLINCLLKLEQHLLNKTKQIKRKFDDIDKDCVIFSIKPKPIKLYITSNGGLVYQVFMAIDTIMNMKVPVHTICKGLVASAGTLLSLAGRKRYITENSYMLIHQIRSGMTGKFSE
jgi:ATP-dependent Clp protease protease subunit